MPRVSAGKGSKLEQRVIAAAEAALAAGKYVSPLDVLNAIGWLPGGQIDKWRQGRIDPLDNALAAGPEKLAAGLGPPAPLAPANRPQPPGHADRLACPRP